MALLNGLDPVVFGSSDRLEYYWTIRVLEEAERIKHERLQALVDAIGVSVGNHVAKRIAEMFR